MAYSNSPGQAQAPKRLRRRALWQAIRLLAGGIAATASLPVAADGLPLPAAALVAAGQVLPPTISGNTMTIQQLSDKATLDWQSFNIAAQHSVRFEQPQATSVALNRIHQADPSQIMGSLSANGQVYLVNQNGFVFGNNAQVNANTLVVSTLNIADETLQRGLTQVVDSSPTTGPVAALSGDGRIYRLGADGGLEKIAIRVEPGASMATNAAGGRILLAAPSIQNRGQITANDGQVILAAASDKVYLQAADSNSDLRGILVEVNTGGDISNLGKVLAERGNVTLLGFAVRQQGLVSATTSVALDGSVRLLAREGAALKQQNGQHILIPQATLRGADNGDGLGTQASVTFAGGSRTAVDLDGSGGTAVDEQTQPRSRIDVEAGRIAMDAGAVLQAPNGLVNLTASERPDSPLTKTSPANSSRILLAAGSKIDVSGSTDTVLPMARNVVNVELRANELRDAPLQKSGILYAKTVQVDVRTVDKTGHIPIADISGALARIQRTVSERNAQGGIIKLSSEGDVILDPDSQIDLSGGLIRYLDGIINTTRLVDADGRIIDIAKADPLFAYQQIFGSVSKYWQRWGITETWNIPGPLGNGGFEQGYNEGQNAGSLTIKSREVLMQADILSRTVDGILQRQRQDRPDGGSLSIQTAWSGEQQQAVEFRANLEHPPIAVTAAFPNTSGKPAPLVLTNQVFSQGVRHVSIDSMGKITINPGVTVNIPAHGSLELTGGEIDVTGSVIAPAGAVRLQTQLVSGNSTSLSGKIQLAADTLFDVSGLWINEFPALSVAPILGPLPIEGGSVSLSAQGDLVLDNGSRIKANGGAWWRDGQALGIGKGGDISLQAANPNGDSRLWMGADLSSFSLGQGGILDIAANAIRVTPAAQDLLGNTLYLAPDLLENHGFSQIKLSANAGNLAVDAGINIQLRSLNYQLLNPNWPWTGDIEPSVSSLPEIIRKPVDLNLTLKHNSAIGGYVQDRAITLGDGASIIADPAAKIVLSSDANIRINGSIDAPAGQINVNLEAAAYPAMPDYNPNQAIALGPLARLSAIGMSIIEPNNLDLKIGDVKAGGQVALQANRGYILLDQGASIDVSGSIDTLDIFHVGGTRIGGVSRETVASAAGEIRLTAAEGIVVDGLLLGKAGGAEVGGGNLSIELNAQYRAEPRTDGGDISGGFPATPRIIHLSAESSNRLGHDWFATGAIADTLNGHAYLGGNQVADGGFSGLALKTAVIVPAALGIHNLGPELGIIQMDGDINLQTARKLILDAPVLSWNPNFSGNVSLKSSYVAIGSSLNQKTHDLAQSGSSNLSVDAGWIDLIGAVATQGLHSTLLQSANDIRLIGVNPLKEQNLIGEFSTAGNITLSASQVYPSTLSQYRMGIDESLNPNGLIQITAGNGSASIPLSAAGYLTLAAPRISSAGVLRAPLGKIDLLAGIALSLDTGSLTSTSAGAALIPFGRTQGGLDWVFQIGAYTNIINTPPQQAIRLLGPDIQFKTGATVDISGGGDLTAFEFIPGPGGSVDLLNPNDPGFLDGSHSYQPTYAVLPNLNSPFAPYDPLEFPASGLSIGDSIYLSGGNGLAEGDYTLLPAHYALLPGAFLITPEAGTTDLQPGTQTQRSDGTPIVAGYRCAAGTPERDSRWSGFAIEPGSIARTRSEYQETTASQFYARQTAPLPSDAGSLSVAASQNLTLAGTLLAEASHGGRGGRLDITADQLAIVPRRKSGDTAGGAVLLSAEELNRLHVESLLLGGRRSDTAVGVELAVDAAAVSLQAGAILQGAEILLAATDALNLDAGSGITATGNISGAAEKLQLAGNGSGAILRVSSGNQIAVSRNATAANSAKLALADGAVLRSDGAILLDASNIQLAGEMVMNRGALSLAASRISLGEAPADTTGLLLTHAILSHITADELRLNSLSTVDLYGDMRFSAKQIQIHAAGINGFGQAGETAQLKAEFISLDNALDIVADSANPLGFGQLLLSAKRLQLGEGEYALRGFSGVGLSASDAIISQGKLGLSVDSDLRISAGKLTVTAVADALINAGGFAVTTEKLAEGNPGAIVAGLGGKLNIRGGDITHQGVIDVPAGYIRLSAADNLVLAPGSVLDASGWMVNLGGVALFAPSGSVALSANTGNISLSQGAIIRVDGDKQGGNAGSISFLAANGSITMAGSVAGHAQPDYTGGQLSLNAKLLGGGFSALNELAGQGGFSALLAVRVRQGDLLVAAGDYVRSHKVQLSTDGGDLTVQGVIDASGPTAGLVQLSAGDKLLLDHTAIIRANANGAGETGGKVSLESMDANGNGVHGVAIQAGASINVAGGANGDGGTVAVRVSRNGEDDAALDLASGVITGADYTTAEAVQVYRDVALTNSQVQKWRDETAAYMNSAALNTSLQTRLSGFTLLPGLEIQSSGDMSLNLNATLNTNHWTQIKVNNNTLYYTKLDDVAGALGYLRQISSTGVVKTLQAAVSNSLTTDGSYFFDTDPASPTFRYLYVRVFPNHAQGANRYDPSHIHDNLVEANAWDFLFPATNGDTWRFGPQQVPGILTLRAAGNLDINQNLSDGFALYNSRQLAEFYGVAAANWRNTLMLQPGLSWSYRLVAGADLSSADPLRVKTDEDNAGLSLTLATATSVRSGTGSIDAVASGDIRLTDQTSTLFTAGQPSDTRRYGSFDNTLVVRNFNAEYPIGGGDISLVAGRGIIGAASSQFMSDWLIRTGNWNPADGAGDRPTAWGIAFDGIVVQNSPNDRIQNLKFGFQENIGALGGGNVFVHAGRDIQDLSVMLPTTAKPVGPVVNGQITENTWDLQGGGDLDVRADGNILGGVFFVDNGKADITAGGSITGGTQYTAGPVFALGDSQFHVTARGDINIGAAVNPYLLTQAKFTDKPTYFTTYADASLLNVQSLAGDIHFNNDTALINQQYKIFDSQSPKGRSVLNSFDTALLSIYPGSLQAYALSGAMQINKSFNLYPAAKGRLELLAATDVTAADSGDGVSINQSDLDPNLLLSPALPALNLNLPGNNIVALLNGSDPIPANLHAVQPLHGEDTLANRIVAEYGSINALNGLLVTTAKPVDIYAGLDIVGLGLLAQNVNPGAVSQIAAGRDIKYPIQRDPVSGDVLGASQSMAIAGPGQLQVMAGRHVDLGSSDGIRSLGNLLNPSLNDRGADLLVFAGLNIPANYADIPPNKVGNLFGTLRASATAAANTQVAAAKLAAYQQGYDAIATLFPQTGYQGDIKLFFSTIQTLDGGNIELLAPNGLINVGLPTAFSGNKTASDLGIVVQRDGDIDILVRDDLLVNRSRVFALDGGDITVWSSQGNIDAGRGAKSALSAPLPITSFDSQGNLLVTFPATVSGSGIRAQSGTATGKAGDVILAAPKGIVDAGEAGIGGNNILIVATAVIGAGNIQALGTTSGVPQAQAVIVPAANVGNSLAAAGNAVDAMAPAQAASPQAISRELKSVTLSTLTAQVVGFGACSLGDIQSGRLDCGN